VSQATWKDLGAANLSLQEKLFERAPKLEKLHFHDDSTFVMLDLGALKGLKTLVFGATVGELRNVPQSIETLKAHVSLSHVATMAGQPFCIPAFDKLENLQSLELERCLPVGALEGYLQMPSAATQLKRLVFEGDRGVTDEKISRLLDAWYNCEEIGLAGCGLTDTTGEEIAGKSQHSE
jgi:hypothetical protein